MSDHLAEARRRYGQAVVRSYSHPDLVLLTGAIDQLLCHLEAAGSAGDAPTAGEMKFLGLRFREAFDLLYQVQWVNTLTEDAVDAYIGEVGKFCNRWEYIARAYPGPEQERTDDTIAATEHRHQWGDWFVYKDHLGEKLEARSCHDSECNMVESRLPLSAAVDAEGEGYDGPGSEGEDDLFQPEATDDVEAAEVDDSVEKVVEDWQRLLSADYRRAIGGDDVTDALQEADRFVRRLVVLSRGSATYAFTNEKRDDVRERVLSDLVALPSDQVGPITMGQVRLVVNLALDELERSTVSQEPES